MEHRPPPRDTPPRLDLKPDLKPDLGRAWAMLRPKPKRETPAERYVRTGDVGTLLSTLNPRPSTR